MHANAGDVGSIYGSRRPLGEGNSNPVQYSCLGNPMDRGAWRASVYRVTKSWMWLKTTKRPRLMGGCLLVRFFQESPKVSGWMALQRAVVRCRCGSLCPTRSLPTVPRRPLGRGLGLFFLLICHCFSFPEQAPTPRENASTDWDSPVCWGDTEMPRTLLPQDNDLACQLF